MAPDRLNEAVDRVRIHELIRRMDQHADEYSLPPGAVLRWRLDAGNGFPDLTLDLQDTPEEHVLTALRANDIGGLRFSIIAALRKIVFGVHALAVHDVTGYEALSAIEYYAENHFVRAASTVELLQRLIATLLDLPGAKTDHQATLTKRILRSAPEVSGQIDLLRRNLTATKRRRNEVAHGNEFTDDRIEGLRGYVTPSFEYSPNSRAANEQLDALRLYQSVLVKDLTCDFETLVEGIVNVMNVLLPLAIRGLRGFKEKRLQRQNDAT